MAAYRRWRLNPGQSTQNARDTTGRQEQLVLLESASSARDQRSAFSNRPDKIKLKAES
jgi:hypothetical protein